MESKHGNLGKGRRKAINRIHPRTLETERLRPPKKDTQQRHVSQSTLTALHTSVTKAAITERNDNKG